MPGISGGKSQSAVVVGFRTRMLIATEGICIWTATHFGLGVGLAVGDADGRAVGGEGVAWAIGVGVGSGIGGRLWPLPGWSRLSCPTMINATPARASRMGTAKPGRRRRRTDGSLATGDGAETDQALALAEEAVAASPAGLVTDLDGTLAPIVTVPSEAALVPGAIEALQALRRRLAVVAIVTGRAAHDARRILGSGGDEVLVIGNHGLEWLEPGADAAAVDNALAPVRATIAGLLARIPAAPGVEIEDKGLSATIHYRRAKDPEITRARLLESVLGASGRDIDVREGRRSIELRPVGRGDKGTALRAVVQRFGLRGLVVAGDDATDLDMFGVAQDLRSRGVRSVVLGIAGGHEVPAEIAATVDDLLPDPVAFVRLLTRLAATIR